MSLTEAERFAVVKALYCAARSYEKDAAEASWHTPLAAQFTRQFKEAKALAERIEQADEIIVR